MHIKHITNTKTHYTLVWCPQIQAGDSSAVCPIHQWSFPTLVLLGESSTATSAHCWQLAFQEPPKQAATATAHTHTTTATTTSFCSTASPASGRPGHGLSRAVTGRRAGDDACVMVSGVLGVDGNDMGGAYGESRANDDDDDDASSSSGESEDGDNSDSEECALQPPGKARACHSMRLMGRPHAAVAAVAGLDRGPFSARYGASLGAGSAALAATAAVAAAAAARAGGSAACCDAYGSDDDEDDDLDSLAREAQQVAAVKMVKSVPGAGGWCECVGGPRCCCASVVICMPTSLLCYCNPHRILRTSV